MRCQKLHWQSHKKFCKQLAKDYEKQLAAQLAEEKLEDGMSLKTQQGKPSLMNGEKKPSANRKSDEAVNSQRLKTENDQNTNTRTNSDIEGTNSSES